MTRLLRGAVSGGARERGRRHGELFGAQARERGVLDFYRGFCGRPVFAELPAPVGWTLDRLHGLFAGRLSQGTRERVEGFAEAAGLPVREVLEGMAMPDVLNYLMGVSGRVLSAPTLGCTSAAAWGDYTPDGRLLYARNLDFPGNEVWDRYPLVLRHRPDRGIPYVSFGCAGNVADGITGVNEEGLTVALHQHYSAEVGYWPGGRPILDLAAQVLQFCKDVDAAVALAAAWPAASAWSLVITHWKKREACVIQKTARRTAVLREGGGRLVHSNPFHDEALRRTELDRPVFTESSRLRRRRASALLEEHKGRVEPALLASLLNDRLDPDRGLVRAFGQAIHQPYTVTSVVLDPERGRAWIADGPAPVCAGTFRAVSLWDENDGSETLTPADPLPPEKRRAYDRYLAGYNAWMRRRDRAAALAGLAEAVALDADDPIYRHLHGLFSLMNGEHAAAAASFEAGASLPDLPHRRQASRLWQARALDLLGRRVDAGRLYASLSAERPTRLLHDAARKGAARAYRRAPILPDFLYGDAYAY
jgi:hypothetical protein